MKKLWIFLIVLWCIVPVSYAQYLENRNAEDIVNWKFHEGDLHKGASRDYNDSHWHPITVPHSYNRSQLIDNCFYQGIAWYRTIVEIPEDPEGKRFFLRFNGVGSVAEVFVNGNFFKNHRGAYGAFVIEITEEVIFNNKILVAVKTDNSINPHIVPTNNKLFNNYGGIYRKVQLFSTPDCAIDPIFYGSPSIFISTKDIQGDRALVNVNIRVNNEGESKEQELEVEVKDPKGRIVLVDKKTISVPKGEKKLVNFSLVIQKPKLWNGRKNPYLYTLISKLSANGVYDIVPQKFGIRRYHVDKNNGLYLNGRKLKLKGVCRHQEWELEGNALTDVNHRKDMDLIEEMGANAVRLAHYQQDDLMYTLADQKGMIVWAEIPFVYDYTGREGNNTKRQLRELIYQNFNHPSIFFWGLFNEVRAYDGPDAACINMVKELQVLAKKIDPDRYTTSASDRPIEAPMNNITDLQGWNKFFGWNYGETSNLGDWLDLTHRKHPNIKIAVSEYGAGGNIHHQDLSKLEKPDGDFFPEKYQTTYHEDTWRILKSRPFVWGSFVWNMFDFSVSGLNRGGVKHLNHKGIVTYDRETKKDAFFFYKANWNDEPMIYITEGRRNVRTKAVQNIKVYCNLEKVTLSVNGKKVAKQLRQSEVNIFIFDNVTLKEGKNTITAIAQDNDKKVKHTIKVVYESNE